MNNPREPIEEEKLKEWVIQICKGVFFVLLKLISFLLHISCADDEKERRSISHIDAPGMDPMFDGEYEDWDGTIYTKGMNGDWHDGNGGM